MAIVKMKRLRLVALREAQETLLLRLQRAGCVEITAGERCLADPAWAALLRRAAGTGEAKAQEKTIAAALAALKRYAPARSGLLIRRSAISEEAFLSPQAQARALDAARQIGRCARDIEGLRARAAGLAAREEALAPWTALDLPLELTQTRTAQLTYLTAPLSAPPEALEAALSQPAAAAALFPAGQDRQARYFLLICRREEQGRAMEALRPFSAAAVHFRDAAGTPGEALAAARAEGADLARARGALEAEIASFAPRRRELEIAADRARQAAARAAAEEKMLAGGAVVFLEGWAAADRLDRLEGALAELPCAWELAEPAEGETPPTLLRNPRWMQCMNMVTEMYSLPAYNGIDPNPLIFFFYIFFFGFMFADVAYGALIFAASLAASRLYRPKKTLGQMFQLGQYLGLSTLVCGLFTGGFFGNFLEVFYETFLPGTAMPGWMAAFCAGVAFSPVGAPMTALLAALGIGAVHLFTGQLIHIYMGFRDGAGLEGLLDTAPWWIVFAGIAGLALGGGPAVLAAGVLALILTQGRHAKTLPGKLLGGVGSLYGITGWLSDILSYSRLMALMLATAVIAQVFNTLGALGGRTVWGALLFAAVFLIGHGFNIGVNLIGTYVHAARLQYLEFFSKFYKEGGVPFRPLEYDTQYVDITEEEQ